MSTDGKNLRVESAQLQHTGDYTCRAVNQAGEDSKQHKVNVRGETPNRLRVWVIKRKF